MSCCYRTVTHAVFLTQMIASLLIQGVRSCVVRNGFCTDTGQSNRC